MIACACGGILEVGLFSLIVTGVAIAITWVTNRIRRRRYCRAIANDLAFYAQQSNEELAA